MQLFTSQYRIPIEPLTIGGFMKSNSNLVISFKALLSVSAFASLLACQKTLPEIADVKTSSVIEYSNDMQKDLVTAGSGTQARSGGTTLVGEGDASVTADTLGSSNNAKKSKVNPLFRIAIHQAIKNACGAGKDLGLNPTDEAILAFVNCRLNATLDLLKGIDQSHLSEELKNQVNGQITRLTSLSEKLAADTNIQGRLIETIREKIAQLEANPNTFTVSQSSCDRIEKALQKKASAIPVDFVTLVEQFLAENCGDSVDNLF